MVSSDLHSANGKPHGEMIPLWPKAWKVSGSSTFWAGQHPAKKIWESTALERLNSCQWHWPSTEMEKLDGKITSLHLYFFAKIMVYSGGLISLQIPIPMLPYSVLSTENPAFPGMMKSDSLNLVLSLRFTSIRWSLRCFSAKFPYLSKHRHVL